MPLTVSGQIMNYFLPSSMYVCLSRQHSTSELYVMCLNNLLLLSLLILLILLLLFLLLFLLLRLLSFRSFLPVFLPSFIYSSAHLFIRSI